MKDDSAIKVNFRCYSDNLFYQTYSMKFAFILVTLILLTLNEVDCNPSRVINSHLRILGDQTQNPIIPDKLYAAEIHYSRIPHQYWEHRLQMIKAMGFNALSVYVMWNFHEIEKGRFDYQNGDRNLIGFLDLAKRYDFKVLFRPGPYVCAEWDFGGFPARLLAIKNLVLRANNKLYLNQVRIYFSSLAPIITNYSHTNQGPIIMLQIQNEYGFYGTDKSYMQALRYMWLQVGVQKIPQYYVDWIQNIQKCYWTGANIGINNGLTKNQWDKVRQMEPNGYILAGEIYSGWITLWGHQWGIRPIPDYTAQYEFLMPNNHSFAMYMAHGGTNFGLTAGAGGQGGQTDYAADVTSYDYDAPINEQGSPTIKFNIFRDLAKKYATWKIPQIPDSIKTITINPFIPTRYADLLQNLPEPAFKEIKQLILFEDERMKMWKQGFVAYQTNLNSGIYDIKISVHDFALIYLNGEFIQPLDRSLRSNHTLKLQVLSSNSTLIILVQAMGHFNFGIQMQTDYKGITSFSVTFTPQQIQSSQELTEKDFLWTIYKIPIDNSILKWNKRSDKPQFPHLFRYNLNLNNPGDTYLNMENWKKGYLFVNGYNLGRYWNKGPQQKVFLPGVWLKQGVNEIVVLQLLMSNAKFIKGDTSLKIEKSKIDKKQQYKQLMVINFGN